MCGIIGFIGREGGEHAQEFVMNQYEDQQSRGGKGFGVITADKNTVTVRRSTGETKALIDVARTVDPVIIFHHRYPTSTENTRDQTHPMQITHDELKHDYLIVHNGVITNSHELFKRHTEELGYVYRTYTQPDTTRYNGYGYASSHSYYSKFNDSESLAIEVARFIEGKEKVIASTGSAAFLGLKMRKGTNKAVSIFWGSNGGNPLDFMETEHGILLASELGSDAFATSKNEFYELSFKDIFDAKKNKKQLLDMADMSTLVFAPPPPVVSSTHYYTDTKTDRTPKTEEKAGEKVGTKVYDVDKDYEAYTNSKVVPDGFTQTEWAVRKVAYRKMKDINTAVLSFADYLASYIQNPLPDDAPIDQRSQDYTPEDMIDDTMTMLEDSLNDILHRTYALAEYTLEDEEEDGPPETHPSYLDPADKPSKPLQALPSPTHATLKSSDLTRDQFTLFP